MKRFLTHLLMAVLIIGILVHFPADSSTRSGQLFSSLQESLRDGLDALGWYAGELVRSALGSGDDSPKETPAQGGAQEQPEQSQEQSGGDAGQAQGTEAGGSEAPDSTRSTAGTRISLSDGLIQSATADPFYRGVLSETERVLYDAMWACAQNPLEGESTEISLSLDPGTAAFDQAFQKSYQALLYDHPELFWLYQGSAQINCSYLSSPFSSGHYRVTFAVQGASEQLPQQMQEFYSAADDLLARVDLSRSRARIALQIHDLLIDGVSYVSGAAGSSSTRDYAHTAYGALVRDSSGTARSAYCDGYAFAYEYLLQRCGIPCTFVAGYAGKDSAHMDRHAWNLLQLDDGEWYEVDATWDDVDLSDSGASGELAEEARGDAAYVSRLRHYLWGVTTEQMSSFTPDSRYTYTSSRGWISFLSASVHRRFTAEESSTTQDYVSFLAPTAQGTTYSNDNLAAGRW